MNTIKLPINQWNELVLNQQIKATLHQEKGFLLVGTRISVKVRYQEKQYQAFCSCGSQAVTLTEI